LEPLQGGPGGWVGSVLVDGLVAAMWAARPSEERTTLEVRAARALTPSEREDLESEGRALLRFIAPGRAHEVTVT
jgi:hypothetical protein